MTYTSYISAGIEKGSTARDQLSGGYEVFLYNPTWEPCDTRMTIYFEDRDPYVLEKAIHIPPKWSYLQHSRNTVPEIFGDAAFWGAKYESNVPVIPVLICFTGGFGGRGEDVSLSGGVTHFLGTGLDALWTFPNGIRTEHLGKPVDSSMIPPPFSEFEIYHFLNPNPHTAEVAMTLQYRDIEHTTIMIWVPPQRLVTWNNLTNAPANQPYAVKVVSDVPIASAATRYVYDPQGLGHKGIFVRAGMAGIPGPIAD